MTFSSTRPCFVNAQSSKTLVLADGKLIYSSKLLENQQHADSPTSSTAEFVMPWPETVKLEVNRVLKYIFSNKDHRFETYTV